MGPPTEPRGDPVQVTFIDCSAAIAVSHTFTPVTMSYPTFLSLLNALSGSVAHKLENLPHQYVQGQGFTLSDGGWWYRFVKSVYDGVSEVCVGGGSDEKGPWTLLNCLYGYEKMVGELCLGVKWNGANVEVQHVSALSSISFAFLSMLTSFYRICRRKEMKLESTKHQRREQAAKFPSKLRCNITLVSTVHLLNRTSPFQIILGIREHAKVSQQSKMLSDLATILESRVKNFTAAKMQDKLQTQRLLTEGQAQALIRATILESSTQATLRLSSSPPHSWVPFHLMTTKTTILRLQPPLQLRSLKHHQKLQSQALLSRKRWSW
jgi:hypothetical protein